MKRTLLVVALLVCGSGAGGDCDAAGAGAGLPLPESLDGPGPGLPAPWVSSACCQSGGGCVDVDADFCSAIGGVFTEGQVCEDVSCPQPGACCLFGTCTLVVETECLAGGGDFTDVACDAIICPGGLDGEWRSMDALGNACITISRDQIIQVDDGCVGVPNPSDSGRFQTTTGNRVLMHVVIFWPNTSPQAVTVFTWDVERQPRNGTLVGKRTVETNAGQNDRVPVVLYRR